jgi:hypothetical protein
MEQIQLVFGVGWNTVDSKIQKFKNDWYRCSLTFSSTNTTVNSTVYPVSGVILEMRNSSYLSAQLKKGN